MRTKSPENESSSERKVHGTKVPWNFRSKLFVLGSERSWARKVPVPAFLCQLLLPVLHWTVAADCAW